MLSLSKHEPVMLSLSKHAPVMLSLSKHARRDVFNKLRQPLRGDTLRQAQGDNKRETPLSDVER
jgi:hypothetical protein